MLIWVMLLEILYLSLVVLIQTLYQAQTVLVTLVLLFSFKGKVILFSSCEIGRLEKTMRRIVKEAQLAGIIAYRAEVTDTFANLAETMIYHRLILSSDSPRKIVKDVNSALKTLGVKCVDKTLRGPALACFS